jgi:hypothetical protein
MFSALVASSPGDLSVGILHGHPNVPQWLLTASVGVLSLPLLESQEIAMSHSYLVTPLMNPPPVLVNTPLATAYQKMIYLAR